MHDIKRQPLSVVTPAESLTESELIERLTFRLLDLIQERNQGQFVKPALEALSHDLVAHIRETQERICVRYHARHLQTKQPAA